MSGDLAVVFDVAGTMLEMYRVAKDISRDSLLRGVVTTDLVMEKDGRALVVPNIDSAEIMAASPQTALGAFVVGRGREVRISCSSTPVSEEDASLILLRSEVKMADLQEGLAEVCAHGPRFYCTTGVIVDADIMEVSYSISTGGKPFIGLEDVLGELLNMGADIYVASGDSMRSLFNLTRCRGICQDRICSVSTPKKKKELVLSLKEGHGMVVMVGDGLNDRDALRVADIGLLTVQQDTHPPAELIQAADRVIDKIDEIPGIIEDALCGSWPRT